MSPLATRHQALREATRRLLSAEVEDAEHDALRLLAHASGCAPLEIASQATAPLEPDVAARFEALVGERARRVPLQHIVGTVGFHAIELEVSRRVLVPRAETELLVDAVLDWLKVRALPAPRVLDLGTGSGAIAIAIARARLEARVVATDASLDALAVAGRNAARNGVAARIALLAGCWFQPLRRLDAFDVVVSNPPYVTTAEIGALAPEVREHDPRLALDGGPDGLAPYRAICAEAPLRLRSPGLLALEVAGTRAAEVAALARDAGFETTCIRADYAGWPRVVLATI